MGRFFRVPKRNDIEQWKKVRVLWDAGFRFWTGRGNPLPERLRDVDVFIKNNPRHPLRLREFWNR